MKATISDRPIMIASPDCGGTLMPIRAWPVRSWRYRHSVQPSPVVIETRTDPQGIVVTKYAPQGDRS